MQHEEGDEERRIREESEEEREDECRETLRQTRDNRHRGKKIAILCV